jgi:drug/metabolite transporter (DMT)-like permease
VFGAVCGSAAYTLLGKRLQADMEAIDLAAIASLIGLLLFLPFAVPEAAFFDWSSLKPEVWPLLIWWAAGTLALGTLLWYLGVSRVSGSTAAGFMGAMPLSALALSYLLLGEPFRPVHLIGAALVVAAIACVGIGRRRGEERTATRSAGRPSAARAR